VDTASGVAWRGAGPTATGVTWNNPSGVFSHPDSPFIHNPQSTCQLVGSQGNQEARRYIKDCPLVLAGQSENDDSWMGTGGIRLDVGKVGVERHEDSIFGYASLSDRWIGSSAETLVNHGESIVATCPDQLNHFYREVFVSLEKHDSFRLEEPRRAPGRAPLRKRLRR